jgi:hypothetical protein
VRKLILQCSRKLFGWPPVAASFDEKAALIQRYRSRFGLNVFVETGTFKAEMIKSQLGHFQKLVSVELSQELFEAARAKFAGDTRVKLYQGDSGVKLGEAVSDLAVPALFWLDAHYSMGVTAGRNMDAPIIRELSWLAARNQPHDVILIDDARLFGWEFGYPRLKVIREYAARHWPRHSFAVESDVICISPGESANP